MTWHVYELLSSLRDATHTKNKGYGRCHSVKQTFTNTLIDATMFTFSFLSVWLIFSCLGNNGDWNNTTYNVFYIDILSTYFFLSNIFFDQRPNFIFSRLIFSLNCTIIDNRLKRYIGAARTKFYVFTVIDCVSRELQRLLFSLVESLSGLSPKSRL